MIEKIKIQVDNLLKKDNSGHGMDHVDRVLKLSLRFAEKENADKYIVSLIALLHDVDDYKLFGVNNAENLINAKRIMADCDVEENIQELVCLALNNIGYNKRLKGCFPPTLEGKIVSDADMCDALGAIGVICSIIPTIFNIWVNYIIIPILILILMVLLLYKTTSNN